jgi:hypothetical protein
LRLPRGVFTYRIMRTRLDRAHRVRPRQQAAGGERGQQASAEALRASEERLRASITGLPVGALAIDLEAGGDQAALEHSLPITGDSPREPTVRM